MTTTISPEYIIGNLLISRILNAHETSIPADEVSYVGAKLQENANIEKLNTIFMHSKNQIMTSLYNFADYFTYDKYTHKISVKDGITFSKLQERFQSCMNFEILEFMVKIIASKNVAKY